MRKSFHGDRGIVSCPGSSGEVYKLVTKVSCRASDPDDTVSIVMIRGVSSPVLTAPFPCGLQPHCETLWLERAAIPTSELRALGKEVYVVPDHAARNSDGRGD
jgi:hypothetical protein